MNKSVVKFIIGRILRIEAVLMIAPLIVSFIYKEDKIYQFSFLIVMVTLLFISQLLCKGKVDKRQMYAKEGFIIVSLSWIVLSFFGSLPFVISGDIPSFIDAFFETSSGFTTTGSSILTDVEALAHSMLFWRSFTHLVGGMGVLVFALAVMPQTGSESVHIMKAEVPGPVFGKVVAKLSASARILYAIYLAMAAVMVILLLFGGMSFFDALLHAFGTAGTGGFGVRNGSILAYDSTYIDVVLSVGMILFGINFNLYYLILIGHIKEVFSSEELRWYFAIIGSAILLICLNIYTTYESIGMMVRDVFFSVSSIITTTGFSTVNFGEWPLFSRMILVLLMFFGGMAGSTAGGLKISRIALLIKSAIAEFKRMSQPNRIVVIKHEKKTIEQDTLRSVVNYLLVYIVIFIALVLIISLDFNDFESAFSSIVATFNNIGPGLGTVGPMGGYSGLSNWSKIVLSFVMIAGRLEIFPIIILFSPRTWRR
ncbi:TrkH family potassium uptake protein [Carnobacterium sp. TMP28]|uniref:TrkH family potassium uptake protein n=1 Tax=Carnobacterium sp. TMP28 TaxID=3397060 RepID=UPI0039E0A646